MDEPETPALVASQASVSQTQTALVDLSMVLMNFMKTMQDREEANQKRNYDMLEQHRLETEMLLEQQWKEMDLRMEQQRNDMVIMADMTMQNVINQIPLIVQNALLGIGSVMNIAPLQLKGPASSQPLLMLMEGHQMPQGSGSYTHAKSSRMRAESPPHLFAKPNPDKERSHSPPNALAEFEAITMDVDDVPHPTGSPAGG